MIVLILVGCDRPKQAGPTPTPRPATATPQATPKPVVVKVPSQLAQTATKTAMELMQEGRWKQAELRAYTFEQSAEDALYRLKDLENKVRWTDLGNPLQAIEAYNGTGYQRFHSDVPSPYLWAGTTLYTRGEYVADEKFDATAIDKQLGCAAVLKRLKERAVALLW